MTTPPDDGTGQCQLSLLQSFDYQLIRSRRRTLSIIVRDNRVVVRAPLKAPLHWIRSFVEEKSDWIQRQLLLEQQRQAQRPLIAAGSLFPYLGEARLIRVQNDRPRRVELAQEELILYTPDTSPTALQTLLFRWLHEQASAFMVRRTREVAQSLDVAHRLKTVTFRKTRSKWGHCRQDGTIQYNWLIMMAPPRIVDYLIIHETSHLRHMDHSEHFWATVAQLCPDYRASRRWLHEHGHRLWPALPDRES